MVVVVGKIKKYRDRDRCCKTMEQKKTYVLVKEMEKD